MMKPNPEMAFPFVLILIVVLLLCAGIAAIDPDAVSEFAAWVMR